MRIKFRNLIIAAFAMMIIPSVAFAADTAAAKSSTDAGTWNFTLIILISISTILLLVIGVLANVTSQFSESLLQIYRDQKSKIAAKSVVLILLFSVFSLHSMAADAVKPVADSAPIIAGVADLDSYTILTFIVLEFVIIFGLLFSINSLKNKIDVLNGVVDAPEEQKAKSARKSWFWDNFNAAASLEKEKDVLLDHNYDGIQELDNSLPPWWKYGFYITIVAAAIYFFRYQIAHTGPNPEEEYATEMAQGEADKEAYLEKAGNSVDENTVTLLTDEASKSAGKEIFAKNCTPCHLADGGGIVGPNLTDDYWLHGGSLKDIFKTIKYGYQEKGMKSWKDDFSPIQIQQVACYVKSLRGTKPANPKAPQGDLYIEATPTARVATDSTTKK